MTEVRTLKNHERSCVCCGRKAAKRELFRVVRTGTTSADFDASGRAAGRGAYVCSAACLKKAIATKKLDRALRASLTEDDYERISQGIAAAMSESVE